MRMFAPESLSVLNFHAYDRDNLPIRETGMMMTNEHDKESKMVPLLKVRSQRAVTLSNVGALS
jgi:hypothetical protein